MLFILIVLINGARVLPDSLSPNKLMKVIQLFRMYWESKWIYGSNPALLSRPKFF